MKLGLCINNFRQVIKYKGMALGKCYFGSGLVIAMNK